MRYTFKREKIETKYLRPRAIPGDGEGMALKALINVTDNKGHLCWGIVNKDDKFVVDNQQLKFNPWTGAKLPATVEELKKLV